MSRRLFAVVTLLAGCTGTELAFQLPAREVAVGTRSTITGTLDTSSGAKAPGQREVVLIDSANAAISTRTAEDGQFAFSEVSPGKYALEVDVPGFKALKLRFEVLPGKPTDLGKLALEFFATDPAATRVTVIGRVAADPGIDPAQASVELRRDRDVLVVTTPSADGTFTLIAPVGAWSLRATHPLCSPAEDARFVVPSVPLHDVRSRPRWGRPGSATAAAAETSPPRAPVHAPSLPTR